MHVATREVMDVASTPYYDRPTAERAADGDERRICARLDQHLPAVPGDGAREVLRDGVYRRAMRAADSTRDERIADAYRFADRNPHLYSGRAAADRDDDRAERDETGRGRSL